MRHASLVFFFVILFFTAPFAWAVENIKSPGVEKGKWELELPGKYQHDRAAARDGEREQNIELGTGLTEHWKAKIEFIFKEKNTTGFYYDAFKFMNTVQLTSEKNGDLLDAALYGDVAIADRTDGTHDYSLGILARKKLFDVTAHTFNLLVKQDFGDTAKKGVNVITRWQSRYNLSDAFAPGFEILSDTRKKEAFRDQSLRIGPMAYGKFAVGGDGQAVGYELGYLFGVTPATSDGMLKWKLKYEWTF